MSHHGVDGRHTGSRKAQKKSRDAEENAEGCPVAGDDARGDDEAEPVQGAKAGDMTEVCLGMSVHDQWPLFLPSGKADEKSWVFQRCAR